jgi:hypothetical protein
MYFPQSVCPDPEASPVLLSCLSVHFLVRRVGIREDKDTTILLNGQYIGMDKRQLAVKTAAAGLGL